MSLQLAAQHLSHQGRFGDSTLVHMSPVEVAALQKLAEKHGMSLTINPETGLPEAFSLKKLLPAIIGMGLNFFAPGIGSAIGSALGTSAAVGTGLAVGGFEALRTGDLGRGIAAGLGAYGGASLGAGLSSLGSSAAENAAILAQTGGEEATGQILQEAARKGAADFAAQPFMDRLGQGVSAAINSPSAFAQSLGGNKELMKTGLALAAPIVADEGVQTTTKMPTSEGYLRPYVYDPYTQGLTALTPVAHRDAYPPPPGGKSGGLAAALAGGGAVAFADGGSSFVAGGGGGPFGGFNTKAEYDRAVAAKAEEDARKRAELEAYQVTGKSGYGDFYARAQADPTLLRKFHNESDADALMRLKANIMAEEQRQARLAALRQQGAFSGGIVAIDGNRPSQPDPNTPDPNTPDPNRPDPNTPDPNRPDPNTPTPINPIIPAPPPPPPYVRPDPFDPGKVPIDRLPTIEQKKPEDVLSGRSLEAYNALMGKGSTATKQWETAPMRPYLPGAGQNQYVIQRDGTTGVTDNQGSFKDFVDKVLNTNTTNLTNPAIYPSEPAGPGMEWYYDGTKWAKRPITGSFDTNIAAAAGGLMSHYADGGTTGNPYYIIRDGVAYINGKPAELSDPYRPPQKDPGPGMKWVWESSKGMWVATPASGGSATGEKYFYDAAGNAGATVDGGPSPGVTGPEGFSGMTAATTANTSLAESNPESGGAPASTTSVGVEGHGVAGVGIGEGGPSAGGSASGGPGDSAGVAGSGAKHGGLLHRYAMGGLGSLGGYSDGGRLLRGPGDGVSDSIPATIADRRPARLADGEFVVPARIVSELGNGSTEAGARKLYAMMDRVQKARGKTTGKGRVAVNSRADKHLPA